MTTVSLVRGRGATLLRAAAEVGAAVVVVLASFGSLLLLSGRLPIGAERGLVLPVLAAACVAVLLHGPVRRRATRLLRPHPDGRSPEQVLADVGTATTQPTGELLIELAGALRTALRVDVAEVWSANGRRFERQVSSPGQAHAVVALTTAETDALLDARVVGEAWAGLWVPDLLDGGSARVRIAAVVHAGVVVALLVVRRGTGAPFSANESHRLAAVAERLGVLLHNRQLDQALSATVADLRRTNAELAASRARVVAAADAERRRIERDLHDGAQQHLTALALHLRLARELAVSDPEAAARAMEDLGSLVAEVARGVRDLARGIYPSALEEGGIAEAIRGVTDRAATPVRLREGSGLRRYRPELEAAVYFVVLEALQNAATHAPEAAVVVELDEVDGTIVFAVTDDGPGFDVGEPSSGRGRQNARDRLGAFGGDVRWDAGPGAGCTVRGWVPTAGATR